MCQSQRGSTPAAERTGECGCRRAADTSVAAEGLPIRAATGLCIAGVSNEPREQWVARAMSRTCNDTITMRANTPLEIIQISSTLQSRRRATHRRRASNRSSRVSTGWEPARSEFGLCVDSRRLKRAVKVEHTPGTDVAKSKRPKAH